MSIKLTLSVKNFPYYLCVYPLFMWKMLFKTKINKEGSVDKVIVNFAELRLETKTIMLLNTATDQ